MGGFGLNNNSSIYRIFLSNNSAMMGISLYQYATMNNMHFDTDSSCASVTLQDYASMVNIQTGVDGGWGGVTLLPNVSFQDFEIGQNSGFCCDTFDTNKNQITISRNFNNLYTNAIVSGGTSFVVYGDLPSIDPYRTYQYIDISGVTEQNWWYYLGQGQFEGQEVYFFLNSDGTWTDPTNIRIYVDAIANPNGTTYVTSPWYPFFSDISDTGMWQYNWKSQAKATWLNGRWYFDNRRWD